MKWQRVCFWLLVLPASLPTVSLPRQAQAPIRVQTTLVNVPVLVRDRQGGSVLGLKAEDFALFDDGIRQPLAFFAAATEPIRIALLLDTSKSMTADLDRIRKAAAGFIPQLRPQDQAMVASFDADIRVLCRLSSDQKELKRAIRGAAIGAYVGTKMRDALALVVDKHLRAARGRAAIILLSDGQDFGSRATEDDVIRTVTDAGVVVYPIFYRVDRRELAKKLFDISLPRTPEGGGASWEAAMKSAAAGLRRFADESAGALYESEKADLKKAFLQIAEELRHQYLLAFYPDPSRLDGQHHAIQVTVSRPDFGVRARRGYQAVR